MSNYASGTSVAVSKSKAEIEQTLIRFGADQFISGWAADRGLAMIQFRYEGRMVKFTLAEADINEDRFRYGMPETKQRERNADAAYKAWEQDCREQWRALALCIKAKLVAVEAGVAAFETEFMPYTLLPDGRTAAEFMEPQLQLAYEKGNMPKELPGLPGPEKG